MDNDTTMIKLKVKTKRLLEKRKIIPRESLNDVIFRLSIPDEKVIYEIGDLIRVRKTVSGRMLTPKEIIESVEYKKEFKTRYPEISKLIEGAVLCTNKQTMRVMACSLLLETWRE